MVGQRFFRRLWAPTFHSNRLSRFEDHIALKEQRVVSGGGSELLSGRCVPVDAAAVLRVRPRSFALRVRGQSMAGAGICDGDIVVGEFTPNVCPGAVVVALVDGESMLKRLVIRDGAPQLISENPNCPDVLPLSELVIQGVVHTVVRRVT